MELTNSFTDPTYLRSICDGLEADGLQKDNAAALPNFFLLVCTHCSNV
jgi:hypothetical protein